MLMVSLCTKKVEIQVDLLHSTVLAAVSLITKKQESMRGSVLKVLVELNNKLKAKEYLLGKWDIQGNRLILTQLKKRGA